MFLSLTVEEALVAFGLGFLYNDVEELGSVAACYYKVLRQVLNKNVQLIKCHNKELPSYLYNKSPFITFYWGCVMITSQDVGVSRD